MKILFSVFTLVLLTQLSFAKATKVDGKTINIDGHYSDTKQPVQTDEELKSLKGELQNVRNLKKNYQKKQKLYGKLVQESEGLKENFEGYLEQRDEWNSAIDGYNQLLECTQNKASKDCLKNSSKKSKKSEANNLNEDRAQKVNQRRNREQQAAAGVHPVQKWDRSLDMDYDMEMDSIGSTMSAPAKNNNINGYINLIDQSVAGRGFELNYCYRKSRTKQEGVLPLMLKIDGNGRLDHLSFLDTTQVYNKGLINCLSRVLYSINYPRTPNGKVLAVKKIFTFELHNI